MSDGEDEWEAFAADVLSWKSRRSERRRRKAAAAEAAPTEERKRKQRAREQHKRQPLFPENPKGSKEQWRLQPENSPWWADINRRGVRVKHTRAYNKFRRKFRLPLVEVEKLVARAQSVAAWKDKPSGVGGMGVGQAAIHCSSKCWQRCSAWAMARLQ